MRSQAHKQRQHKRARWALDSQQVARLCSVRYAIQRHERVGNG